MVDTNQNKEFWKDQGAMEENIKTLTTGFNKVIDKIEAVDRANRKSRGDLYDKLREYDEKNTVEHTSIMSKVSDIKTDNVRVSKRVATIYSVCIAFVIALIGYFIDKV